MKDDANMMTELGKYGEQEKKYVLQGVSAILIRNIDLPKNDAVKKNNRKAMDGIKLIKKDKTAVENVFSKIRYIFNHYAEQGEAQKKEAYEQVKEQFAMKLQQAVQQQMGTNARMDINVDNILNSRKSGEKRCYVWMHNIFSTSPNTSMLCWRSIELFGESRVTNGF